MKWSWDRPPHQTTLLSVQYGIDYLVELCRACLRVVEVSVILSVCTTTKNQISRSSLWQCCCHTASKTRTYQHLAWVHAWHSPQKAREVCSGTNGIGSVAIYQSQHNAKWEFPIGIEVRAAWLVLMGRQNETVMRSTTAPADTSQCAIWHRLKWCSQLPTSITDVHLQQSVWLHHSQINHATRGRPLFVNWLPTWPQGTVVLWNTTDDTSWWVTTQSGKREAVCHSHQELQKNSWCGHTQAYPKTISSIMA